MTAKECTPRLRQYHRPSKSHSFSSALKIAPTLSVSSRTDPTAFSNPMRLRLLVSVSYRTKYDLNDGEGVHTETETISSTTLKSLDQSTSSFPVSYRPRLRQHSFNL
ncbi:MAG: hypothetical protein H6687_01225 [Bacillales bacterium]|nr:hypothetical protein [Bacillales bacterium]